MGVIGLTAIEILAYCLGAGLILAILVVLCNCVTTCYETLKYRRKKAKIEKLPDDYVDEIHQLLARNRNLTMNANCVVLEGREPNIEYIEDTRLSSPQEMLAPKLLRQKQQNHRILRQITEEDTIHNTNTNSSSNSTISLNTGPDATLKEHLDLRDREGESEETQRKKRRTWGRLSSSQFDTVFMPSVDTTTTEESLETQTNRSSCSIDNLRIGMKIETTV